MVADLLQTKKVENVFVAGEYLILHKFHNVGVHWSTDLQSDDEFQNNHNKGYRNYVRC